MSYEETIYQTAFRDGMPPVLSRLIVAQAKHETGNFTSNIFREGNNAFGYSYVPGAKYQLPSPGRIADNSRAAAKYLNLENSVHEITAWIKRRVKDGRFPLNLFSITQPEQYAALLKKAGYFTDSLTNYANALKKFFSTGAGAVSVAGVVLVGLTIFF